MMNGNITDFPHFLSCGNVGTRLESCQKFCYKIVVPLKIGEACPQN